MNYYMFYTEQGQTEDIDGEYTDNHQILGWAEGHTMEEAFQTLIEERYMNGYNMEDGRAFNFDYCIGIQLVGQEQDFDIPK